MKNIILCAVAGVLLIGGAILIVPMFRAGEKGTLAARANTGEPLFANPVSEADALAEDPRAAVSYMFSDEYSGLSASAKAKYKDALVDALSDPLLELNDYGPGEGQRGDRTDGQRGGRAQGEGQPGERPRGEGQSGRGEITDEQRAAFEEMMELRGRIEAARDKKFFDLNEADQTAVLDHRIEHQEQWAQRRKEMLEWAKANPDNEHAKHMLSRASGNSVATGNTDERVERSMARSQRRSPEQRAYRDEIDRRTDERRRELGLGPAPTGGGGFHR